jgi:3-methyladenine DNA glycosylase/8-oxoguanine DNA glycosylase
MGMKKLYGLESEGKELERELMALAAQWKPYRSYGSKLIWKGKDFE